MSSPSMFHQLLVELVEKQMDVLLPPEALRPPGADLAAWASTKNELGSPSPAELRADLVMRLGPEGAPQHVTIVEVQMRWDEDKRWRWPHYFAAASDRYRCGVSVLVVTPTRQVAARCAPPAEFPPGLPWRPLVLGPDEAHMLIQRTSRVTYSTEARLLLVLLAGRLGGESMAHHALEVIRSLDTTTHPHYLDLVDRMLSAAGRTLLRSLTMNQLAQNNVSKQKNSLTRALVREGEAAGARKELLGLAALRCTDEELAVLREVSDLDALREAVYARLGSALPGSAGVK